MAYAGEYAHHSTGPAYDVHKFDAENGTERRGNDGRVECATCAFADIAVDAWPTRSDGICEEPRYKQWALADTIPEP